MNEWTSGTVIRGTAGERDTLIAAGPHQILDGMDLDDVLLGSANDDVLIGGQGSDTLFGGGGRDLAVFAGPRAAYALDILGNGQVTVTLASSIFGPEIDSLYDIDRLQFDDAQVALDVNGNAGDAYRLYQAAFDRVPDLAGLGYQMHDLDLGYPLAQVAANFIASPEFQAKYGNLADAQFVTQLYKNVLHREPEPFEVIFHVDNELHGGFSRAQVLTFFSDSPENRAYVIGQIEGGMLYVY